MILEQSFLANTASSVLADLVTILPYALLLLATFWGLSVAINSLKGIGSGGLPHVTVTPPFDYNKALDREWRRVHKEIAKFDKLEKEYDKQLADFNNESRKFDDLYAKFKELRKRV